MIDFFITNDMVQYWAYIYGSIGDSGPTCVACKLKVEASLHLFSHFLLYVGVIYSDSYIVF